MKKISFILVLAIMFMSLGRLALADPITDPTHFDDTFWNWPTASTGYTSMSTVVTPLADGSPDGYYFSNYYWFSGDYSATGGYLGFQTEGTQPTGKIAIFSIWGATSSNGPGYNAAGTEVGQQYWTSRISYPWTVNNSYLLNISLTSQSGGSNTWTGTITDETTHAQSLIGNIIVPTSRGNLYDVSVTFHERYSGPTASCSDLQKSEVEFTGLTANNGSVSPTSHTNYGATGTGCASSFATQDISGGIESIIGGQFPPAPTPTPTPAPTPTKPVTTPTTATITPVTKLPTVDTPKATTSTTPKISAPEAKIPVKKTINAKLVMEYTSGIIVLVLAVLFGFILFIRRKNKSVSYADNPQSISLNHVSNQTVPNDPIVPNMPNTGVIVSPEQPDPNQINQDNHL